jgi:hypothetical protein
MSALTPKADIDWRHSNVRFVPIADILQPSNAVTSSARIYSECVVAIVFENSSMASRQSMQRENYKIRLFCFDAITNVPTGIE